ncbi:MAG: AI-2E family transporter [Anaerolineae bacterium]|nr:AI-2E family transporter [Anaerolineae bacterium]
MSTMYQGLFRWLLSAFALVAIALVLITVKDVLLIVLLAVLVGMAIDFPIRVLQKFGLSRQIGTPIVILAMIAMVVLLNIITVPTFVRQAERFANEVIPDSISRFDRWYTIQVRGLQRNLDDVDIAEDVDVEEITSNIAGRLTTAIGDMAAAVPPIFTGIANTIASMLIILFLVIYMLAEPETYRRGAMQLFPKSYQKRANDILHTLDYNLRGWIRATFVGVIFMGAGTFLLLVLIGLDDAFFLSVNAAISSVIPNFGTFVAMLLALMVGASNPEVNLLLVFVIILVMTFLQNQVLLPILMKNHAKLPPMLVIIGQIVFGILFGFLGLLLAVPLTIIVSVLIREVYVVDYLGNVGDPTEEPMPELNFNEPLAELEGAVE